MSGRPDAEAHRRALSPPNVAMRRHAFAPFVIALSLGCATGGTGAPAAPDAARAGTPLDTVERQTITDSASLVPAGFGTLRQEDIAVRITLRGVQVRAIPLDEAIIRVLSPDSYRALRDLLESRRGEVTSIAGRYGVRRPSVWYISYFGVQPDARFSPMEVIVTSAGRDYRPLDLIPLSPGFGENRLQQRESQTALYVFEEDVDPEQPLAVTIQGERSSAWSDILQRIQRERALIRSRSQGRIRRGDAIPPRASLSPAQP